MPEKDNNPPLLDIKTTAVLMAVVLGGAALLPTPLRSSRPSEKRSLDRTSLGDQVVPARLWQDPFQAALNYHAKHPNAQRGAAYPAGERASTNTGPAFGSLGELSQQIGRRSRSGRPITILEVMIAGGSYAEDAESRQRARYAVLSAIGVAGYIPLDSEHLGYAQTDWPRGKMFETNQSQTLETSGNEPDSFLIVPFEWFSPNDLRGEAASTNGLILVLWLNDAAFEDHPLQRLAHFNNELLMQAFASKTASQPGIAFKLLEPRLPPMLSELAELRQAGGHDPVSNAASIPVLDGLTNLEFYSSWSTTADAVLGQGGRNTFNNPPGCNPWSFTAATSTDDHLAEEIIDELYLRNINLADTNNFVLLISEWDTFYGRALPLTFAATVKCRINDRFTAASFLDITNLFAILKNRADPAASSVSKRLSRSVRRLLDNPDAPPNFGRLLAHEFNRLAQTDLREWASLPWSTNEPALVPLRSTNTIPPTARRIHLNRLLLENAFQGHIRCNSFAAVVEDLRAHPSEWPPNIIRCTYLRGIDGKLPDEEAETGAGEQTSKDNKETNASDSDSSAPRPEGHQQLDYMPRLADRLERVEEIFKRYDRGELKAIGILGSDVYDKLLILQSLRRAFTDEVFFTTDLDARLLHGSALKWTRNVLVASSFGLQLGWKFQKETPPFRDTYQTGQYLCCLAALDYTGVRTSLQSLTPRRFEIGRGGAYDLSNGSSPLYPQVARTLPWTGHLLQVSALWFAAVLLLAVLATVLAHQALRAFRVLVAAIIGPRYTSLFLASGSDTTLTERPGPVRDISAPPAPFSHLKSWWTFRASILFPLLLMLVLCLCIVWDHHWNEQGEPFSLTSGISIWPTEIFRAAAAALAVLFLFKSHSTLLKNKDDLLEELKLAADPTKAQLLTWREFFRKPGDFSFPSWGVKRGAQKKTKQQLYDDYARLGALDQRVCRVGIAAICYGALASVIYYIFDPPFQPVRGRLSLWCDYTIEVLGSIALILLVFFVADASRLCRKFIDNIVDAPKHWPDEVGRGIRFDADAGRNGRNEYIDLRVIAVRSDAVGQLILYPFFVLFLLIVARNDFFDRWDWPPSLLLFFGLNSAYAAYVVWSLRRSAEKARDALLKSLNQKLLRALAHPRAGLIKQLKLLIQRVESCREGAFAPITQQPVIKALLMPFGGAGVLTLLNYLAGKA